MRSEAEEACHSLREGGDLSIIEVCLEVRCRRWDIEVWRSGAREACCGAGDVDLQRSGDALQIDAKRHLPQELWSSSVLFVVVGISSFRSSRVLGQNACVLPLHSRVSV